jgi:DNA-binding NarL/FixJ family response regulator
VLVVDDERLVRAGVRAAVEADPSLWVTAEAETGAAAVEVAERLRPDVVLTAMRIGPGMDGVELTSRVTRLGMTVVVLTRHRSDEDVLAALSAGARGYVLRGCPEETIRHAVREAAAGRAFLDPEVTGQVLQFLTRTVYRARPVPVQRMRNLSRRELQVLRALAEGMPPDRIATALGIALPTVRSHISHVLRKLQVATALEAVAVAHQAGILED